MNINKVKQRLRLVTAAGPKREPERLLPRRSKTGSFESIEDQIIDYDGIYLVVNGRKNVGIILVDDEVVVNFFNLKTKKFSSIDEPFSNKTLEKSLKGTSVVSLTDKRFDALSLRGVIKSIME